MSQFHQRPSGLIVPQDNIAVPVPQEERIAVVPLEQVIGLINLLENVVVPTLQFYGDFDNNREAILQDLGSKARTALSQLPSPSPKEEEGDDGNVQN
jgi:hypothetical protein